MEKGYMNQKQRQMEIKAKQRLAKHYRDQRHEEEIGPNNPFIAAISIVAVGSIVFLLTLFAMVTL